MVSLLPAVLQEVSSSGFVQLLPDFVLIAGLMLARSSSVSEYASPMLSALSESTGLISGSIYCVQSLPFFMEEYCTTLLVS